MTERSLTSGRVRKRNFIDVFVPVVPELAGDYGSDASAQGGVIKWHFDLSAAANPPLPSAQPGGRGAEEHPVVAKIAECSAGSVWAEAINAVEAVKTLRLEPSWWATPAQYRAMRSGRQRWLDAVDVALPNTGIERWKGESTTLGIALGLLMVGARTKAAAVIATGDLRADTRPDPNRPGSDIRVMPIGDFAAKLALVTEWAEKNGLPAAPIQFLTPLQNAEEPPQLISRAEFAELYHHDPYSPGAVLRRLGVELIGVETLHEAAAAVGALRLRPNAADRLHNLLRAAGMAVLLGLGGYGGISAYAGYQRNLPIPGLQLTGLPGKDSAGNEISFATPFRFGKGGIADAKPLDSGNTLEAGETVFFAFRLGDGVADEKYYPALAALPQFITRRDATGQLRSHQLFTLDVNQCRGDTVPGEPLPSGSLYCLGIETRACEAEDMAVILVADRNPAIVPELAEKIDHYESQESHRVTGEMVELPLRAMINDLAQDYPGRALATMVRLAKTKDCPP